MGKVFMLIRVFRGRIQIKVRFGEGACALSDAYFNLLSLDCQGHAALGTHFETKRDRLFDVNECFLARFALTDAAGNRGAFGDPHPVLIAIQHSGEFHQHGSYQHQVFP